MLSTTRTRPKKLPLAERYFDKRSKGVVKSALVGKTQQQSNLTE